MTNPLEAFTLDQLRERSSVKWRRHPGTLPLWVAEMDVDVAEPIKDALRRAIDVGDTGYPFGHSYAEAFARYATRHWGWSPDVSRTVNCIDVMTGVTNLVRSLGGDDSIIVTPPVYGPFHAVGKRLGRRTIGAELGADGRLDLESLGRALGESEGGRPVILLSNPHNPTGVAYTADELDAVLALATRRGARVIADEIHAPLMLGGTRFTPLLSRPGSDNAFSVFSASKAYNLAGLKAALIIGGPDTKTELDALREDAAESTSHFGVLSHVAALDHGDEWLAALLPALTANRDLLSDLVTQHLPGARLTLPEATYLAWVDARPLEIKHDSGNPWEPAGFFLERAGVEFSDGPFFGREGVGHFRVNFATRPDILIEALSSAGRALSSR